jgi:hypothetical protein
LISVEAVLTASAIDVAFVHVNVAVPARYVQVPVIPPSAHAIPGERVMVVASIGATHVEPDGEKTHVEGNSVRVHAVPARLNTLDVVRD